LRPDEEIRELVNTALAVLPGVPRQELIFRTVRHSIHIVVAQIIEERKKAADTWSQRSSGKGDPKRTDETKS
jgi:hypothetical protein